MNTPRKVPVTSLTGFPVSGKTTLKRILSDDHGKRIVVIENSLAMSLPLGSS